MAKPPPKQQGNLADRTDPADLPKGWAWVRLGDIADVLMGNSPPGSSYNAAGVGIPLINGPTEFGPGQLDAPQALQYTTAPSRVCEVGDLLVCVRGSTTGRTNVASFRACIGRGIAAVRAADCQPYVNHFLASRQELLLSMGTGSTFPSITAAQLRALTVPLPPLSEQARIVAALERELAEIDRGMEALERARADIPRLRASILRAAVQGELGELGSRGSDREDTAADLLERIADRRLGETIAGQSQRAQQSLFPVAPPATIRPSGEYTPRPYEVPDGWAWASFGQFCDLHLGRSRNPKNRAGRYATPYLRAANITTDGLDLSNVLEMDFPPRERGLYRLKSGDLVVAEASGSVDQVGKPAQWNDELPLCCFQNTVIRLRPVIVLSDYVLILLQHCYFNGVFAGLATGIGINHLGATRLGQIEVPLAPESQQRPIVELVSEQLSAASSSSVAIEANLAAALTLKAAVLDKAFRGRLVEPQSSEPATAIVERTNARRAASSRAASQPIPPKRRNQMTLAPQRRSLLDILRKHPAGMTPEELFAESGFPVDAIDEFFAELAECRNELSEEKPTPKASLAWPTGARVLLRPKVR